MRRKINRVLSFALLAAMIISLAACNSTGSTGSTASVAPTEPSQNTTDETYTIRFSSMNPSEDNKYSVVCKAWFNYIEEQTNGAVQFEEYYNSTAAEAEDQLDAARTGIVDIGEMFSPFWGNNFTLWELFNLPFQYSFPDGYTYTHAALAMIQKYPEFIEQVESQGVHFVLMHGDGVNQIFSKEPIESISDLQGKIFNVGSVTDKKLMEKLGASTEMMDSMDVFDNVSKGVLDGFNQCYAGSFVTGSIDAVSYITEINSSHQGWFFVMNDDVYNSLPEEYRKYFDLPETEEFMNLLGYQFAQDELLRREQLKNDPNYTFIDLGDEYQEWIDAASGMSTEWIDEVTAQGYDGKAMYEDWKNFLAQYADADFSGYKEELENLGVTVPDGWN